MTTAIPVIASEAKQSFGNRCIQKNTELLFFIAAKIKNKN